MQQAGPRSLARGSEKRGAVWNETKKKRLPNGNRRGAQISVEGLQPRPVREGRDKEWQDVVAGVVDVAFEAVTDLGCLPAATCRARHPPLLCTVANLRWEAGIYTVCCEHIVAVQDGWAPHLFRSLVRHRFHGKQAREKKEPGSYLGELLIHAPFLCSSRERGVTVDDQVLSERLPCLRESPRLRLAQPLCECRP